MAKSNTLTVDELIQELKLRKKKYGGDARVFLSRDEEGNGFGTLHTKYSFGFDGEKNVVVLYPAIEVYEYD